MSLSYAFPRKKTSLGESLAGSHAHNLIRDSRRDFLVRKVSPLVSPRVLPRVSDRITCVTPSKTLSETRFFLRGLLLFTELHSMASMHFATIEYRLCTLLIRVLFLPLLLAQSYLQYRNTDVEHLLPEQSRE